MGTGWGGDDDGLHPIVGQHRGQVRCDSGATSGCEAGSPGSVLVSQGHNLNTGEACRGVAHECAEATGPNDSEPEGGCIHLI